MSKEKGYIYILESDVGYYKIGKTKNLDKRLNTFAVSLPFKTSLFQAIEVDDMRYYERWLHNYFAEFRVGGEWFVLDCFALKILHDCIMDQGELDEFIFWIGELGNTQEEITNPNEAYVGRYEHRKNLEFYDKITHR